jgi:hypothetical protein
MMSTVLLRFAVSVALLMVVARSLDAGGVLLRLSEMDGAWVSLALALSVAQVVVLAWRWRFTAGRLGIALPLRAAVAEYYLGLLLNQILPGGVSGDVARAWRHARVEAAAGPAVRAVILERATAQAVMTTVAVGSVLLLPSLGPWVRFGVALAALVAGLVFVAAALGGSRSGTLADRVRVDARAALLGRRALPAQSITAMLVVGSYLAMYVIAARAIGVGTPVIGLLPLVAPVLMTMVIPVTIAGWGIREGAAAVLWASVGMSPEEGVAISMAYGFLVLVSSAPGVIVLGRVALLGDRDRRAHRPRGGSDDREGAAPDRATRSDRA